MTTDCSWNYHENYNCRTWAENVLPMFCPCSSLVVFMVISWTIFFSYCGLVDARISASEKDLTAPVVQLIKFQRLKNTTTQRWLWYPRISTSWAFRYPNVLWPFTHYKWTKIENFVQMTLLSSSELNSLCTETYRETIGQNFFFTSSSWSLVTTAPH